MLRILVVGDYSSFGDEVFSSMREFIDGALRDHREILRYDMLGRKIKNCQNCSSCFTKEVPCSFLDDFEVLAESMQAADALVVFAEGTLSSSFLSALSKFRCFSSPKSSIHLQRASLFLPSSPREEDRLAWGEAMQKAKIGKSDIVVVEKGRAFSLGESYFSSLR
jgi:hypothetical protein